MDYELKRAYVAGWFDARGYIRVSYQAHRTPRLRAYLYVPKEGVAFLTQELPYMRKSTMGSSWSREDTAQRGGNTLMAENRNAIHFLEYIAPYTQRRKDMVGHSLEFLEQVLNQGLKDHDRLSALNQKIKRAGVNTTWDT